MPSAPRSSGHSELAHPGPPRRLRLSTPAVGVSGWEAALLVLLCTPLWTSHSARLPLGCGLEVGSPEVTCACPDAEVLRAALPARPPRLQTECTEGRCGLAGGGGPLVCLKGASPLCPGHQSRTARCPKPVCQDVLPPLDPEQCVAQHRPSLRNQEPKQASSARPTTCCGHDMKTQRTPHLPWAGLTSSATVSWVVCLFVFCVSVCFPGTGD